MFKPRILFCGCGGGGGAAARSHPSARMLATNAQREPQADEVMVRWLNPTKGSHNAWGSSGKKPYATNLTEPFPMLRVDAESARFKHKVEIVTPLPDAEPKQSETTPAEVAAEG